MANKATQIIYPRLTVYSDENFRGLSRTYRGNLGIRNTNFILGGVESLRFFSINRDATLVLFSRTRFRGNFRVYRGITNLRDLDDLINGNDVQSIISTNQLLTIAEIRRIQLTGILPRGYRRI
ncbi:hypothetical protein J2Z69_001659 [Paenibacillus shirakamiensis]|uniref:Uncharacterized protein n=1 Tax=Paenibacillus shirakamiensis TaxID=1265935 RepID=A0ABS4JFZ0_9BACL|nr:hypothetical protein [Paenibacillus shirakamiensis]MBP2000628.1 hypothetical protein [Paenibacillus shirakamiensis]